MSPSSQRIQRLFRDGKYEVSLHAQQERLEENLDLADIQNAGEILEQYPDDPRGESCLLLGFVAGREIVKKARPDQSAALRDSFRTRGKTTAVGVSANISCTCPSFRRFENCRNVETSRRVCVSANLELL